MENNIQIFNNPSFGDIRVAGTSEQPLFCALDVCNALGYSNGRKAVSDHIDEEDVTKCDTLTNGGIQSITYVNESGLYSLILGSKLPNAKEYKHWVTSEVLPSIRKNGAYMTSEVIEKTLTDPDYLIRLATTLKDERLKRVEAENKARLLETINKEQAPKASFADAVLASKSSCLIGELAKILTQNGYEIGQNRLFTWLREKEYLGCRGERYNMPNQQYVENGLFEIKKSVHSENGILKTTSTPKVTTKGQMYFINKFMKKEAVIC